MSASSDRSLANRAGSGRPNFLIIVADDLGFPISAHLAGRLQRRISMRWR